MSTTKTIKIQKNKILTYSINKAGFQTINKTLPVTENTTITETMVSRQDPDILALGARFLGISTFVCYFTPSGEYDVDSLKYLTAKQTTGTGLTNIQVVKSLWLEQIETTLSIETPKGTSKDFIFTFNGSTWDLTGAATVSAISATDLGDVYGITFTGTPATGDVITVTETQYNKFACYVLDSNYRTKKKWGDKELIMPKQYSSAPQNCIESATYYNQYIWDNANLNNYDAFNYCKNLGDFILPDGMKINCMLPNGPELQAIYDNRVVLDSFDPVIQGGSTSNNLTNWSFEGRGEARTCVEYSKDVGWYINENGAFKQENYGGGYCNKEYVTGITPVFEVPVM